MDHRQLDIEPSTFEAAKVYLQAQAAHRPVDETRARLWREFYARCDLLIHRFARIYLRSNTDIDDCAQEVWLKLIDRLTTFEYDPARGAFSSWLYRVVRDTTVSHFRQKTRFNSAGDTALRDLVCDPAFDPARVVEQSDAVAKSYAMLVMIRRHVSRPNYQLVYMRWMQDRTVEEVAKALGLTHQQVWYREHRARQKLRTVLVGVGGLMD